MDSNSPKPSRTRKETPEREVPVVKFRYRPPGRATSNRTGLLIGGTVLIVIVILLLKLF